MAQGHRRGAVVARPGQGHRRLHRRRHRGGACQAGPPARRDRGPADGRDERRRRSLRGGQDVPASGREVGARDEEGRRLPHAVHGGREGRDGRAGRDRADPGQDRPRDGEGRRPRHRQEHRRRRARLQQLRGHRPGRDGPVREDPRTRQAGEGGSHRLERAHHALARRDGARRPRDGAAGVQAAAAHRRRDDQPRAHGREDRAALQRAGGARPRRQPRRARDHEPPQRSGQACVRRAASRRLREAPAPARPAQGQARPARPRAGQPDADPVARRGHSSARIHRRARAGRLPARDPARVHRLDAALPHLGAQGCLPPHPRAREVR